MTTKFGFTQGFRKSIRNSKRSVSTWPQLASVFNSPPSKKINLIRENCGLFGNPALQSFEGFHLLKEDAVNKSDELIAEALSSTRKRKMVQIFDELSDTLCKVADLSEFIRIAHPQNKYNYAAEDACIAVSGIVEKLNTHKTLYQALDRVVKNGDIVATNDVDQHVGKLFLFDFEQSGIHLEEDLRQKVVRLNDVILQLGQRFMSGAINPRSVPKSALPEHVRGFFPADGDNILVSGFYADSSSSIAREAAYKLFLYPDDSQEDLLSDLIKCRHELGLTCGFQTYAHRAINGSTAESPEMIKSFIDTFSKQLEPLAQRDFEIMEKIKRKDSMIPDSRLASWDTPYFTSIVKRKWLNVGSSEFNSYFSLGSCMEGLNILMQRLYGITLQSCELESGEAWHNTIHKLSVVHETEGLLGHIYCDFFERVGKPNQDCHFTIQGGKRLDNGEYQKPIVVIMLNLNQPRWSGPSLLSPGMVDNLFHEMGHAMHSMLARTEYQHVTGTRCSTDFAEVPSVLMEYFASDPRVLRTFAKHYQTGETMPEDMLERLCISKNIFSASETQLQVFYSALDQKYHGDIHQHGTNTTETLKSIQGQYYGLPYVENTAWQLRFSHLVGYGAKYYSYLMSKAISSWIWNTYFKEDPLNRDAGEKYRRECLAHGGGIPSRKLVSNYLGKEVEPNNLADSLINEISQNNDKIREVSQKLKLDFEC